MEDASYVTALFAQQPSSASAMNALLDRMLVVVSFAVESACLTHITAKSAPYRKKIEMAARRLSTWELRAQIDIMIKSSTVQRCGKEK